ncbi:hypothetical protein ABPG73_017013 [Tetrahymena malaccensis]
MDTIQQSIKCKNHQLKDIEFIQVNEVLSQPKDKNIFYCSQCINSDIQFKGINYLLIEQIIQEGSTNILQKWPPVNDNQVLQNLIDLSSGQNDQFDYVEQITQYFKHLKDELISQLDEIQKKMIIKANNYQLNKEAIIKEYQEISSILKLRELLQNNNNLDASSLEKFRSFIAKQESDKKLNTKLLKDLVAKINTNQKKLSFELPNIIKEQITLLANQICFFDEENQDQKSLNQTNQSNQKIIGNKQQNVDQLMRLISNKSNFCSTEFLDSVKKDLNKLIPLFQTSTFSRMFQINKQPIKFDKIKDQNLQLINEYVDHQIELVSSFFYKNKIELSQKIQSTVNILSSKFNFLNQNFINEIKKYLVDTYPFLNEVSYNNFIADQNKFSLFQQLPPQTISNLSIIVSKSFELQQKNTFKSSQSYLAIQNNSAYFDEQQMRILLQQLPFFDVIQKQKIQNNYFFGSNYNNGKERTIVNYVDNQEIEIYLNQTGNAIQILQDYTLKKNIKYIYRFKVQNNQQQRFSIGIVNRYQQNNNNSLMILPSYCSNCVGLHFCFQLQNINNYLQEYGGCCVKQIKGGNFQVQNNNILEMRVDLSNQILEISDYPNYQFVLGVNDFSKQILSQYDDFSFFIQLWDSTKITIQQAFQVDKFENYDKQY